MRGVKVASSSSRPPPPFDDVKEVSCPFCARGVPSGLTPSLNLTLLDVGSIAARMVLFGVVFDFVLSFSSSSSLCRLFSSIFSLFFCARSYSAFLISPPRRTVGLLFTVGVKSFCPFSSKVELSSSSSFFFFAVSAIFLLFSSYSLFATSSPPYRLILLMASLLASTRKVLRRSFSCCFIAFFLSSLFNSCMTAQSDRRAVAEREKYSSFRLTISFVPSASSTTACCRFSSSLSASRRALSTSNLLRRCSSHSISLSLPLARLCDLVFIVGLD
mmetsp:Transcript_19970/g.51008  ORF Transcript_19970/g.51008 Transcript_19970/m.51008 type:complete len:273 (+) Transcript_19970:772-1590(+)